MNRSARTRILSCAFLISVALVGCAGPTAFRHTKHRINYAIQPEELQGLQFTVSKKIVARRLAAGGSQPGDVITLEEGVTGVVLESGSLWLRVGFSDDGRGIPFAATGNAADAGYWLATRTAQGALAPAKLTAGSKVTIDGDTYDIITGRDAQLLVGSEALDALIDSRTQLQGRSADPR